MKTIMAILAAAAISAICAALLVSQRLNASFLVETAAREAAWATERDALQEAAAKPRETILITNTEPRAELASPKKPSAAEILAELKQQAGVRGADARRVIVLLQNLIDCGPAAAPVIREYLASGEDVEFEPAGKKPRDIAAIFTAVAPISLRFALFDALRELRTPEAEKLLLETLNTTNRGIEVAYLTRTLETIFPGRYRDAELAAAQNLLLKSGQLDDTDSDYLYGTLRSLDDHSFVAQAQAQVIRPDGKLDKNAFTYLKSALSDQALPLARQLYSDPRITDPGSKEPLARVALAYVGAVADADQFYQQTINDRALPKSARKNLIEDLNEDGLNFKNLSATDLPLIQKRMELIEKISASAMDEVNAAAFKEAYKDLANMREKAAAAAQRSQQP